MKCEAADLAGVQCSNSEIDSLWLSLALSRLSSAIPVGSPVRALVFASEG